jgi:hypothetical protein
MLVVTGVYIEQEELQRFIQHMEEGKDIKAI